MSSQNDPCSISYKNIQHNHKAVFCNNCHLRVHIKLQQRVLQAISFQDYAAPFTPIFHDLKILKLHDLFQIKLLIFVYQCVNKISPPTFHTFFDSLSNVHQYGTRQATKGDIFLIQKNTLQYGLRSVRYYGAKCRNNIPDYIRRSPSVRSFQCNLKSFIFERGY